MIESIEFTNFKALRKTTLPLAPFTLLLGPNGSGKTSVLESLQGIANTVVSSLSVWQEVAQIPINWVPARSVTADQSDPVREVTFRMHGDKRVATAKFQWQTKDGQFQLTRHLSVDGVTKVQAPESLPLLKWLSRMQTYALDAYAIAQPVPVSASPLQSNGAGLSAVLDNLKDNHPERWESLLGEMQQWLPEYDYILFDKPPQGGQKVIVLRTKKGGYRIPAKDVSQGTLIALALLTLAYLPEPPSLIGLEEIDRGLHPRLLRHLQDALYRLSYPESCGEKRLPIQVIATTHSPYLLDLYRDHPEEVVLAQKAGLEVDFKRLTDIDHFEDILGDAPLSDVWYSGVLGGVAVQP